MLRTLRTADSADPVVESLLTREDFVSDAATGLVGLTARQCFDAFLRASESGSYFQVLLNDTLLWLPVETIRTMVHCLIVMPDGQLAAYVETAHLRWMMERLRAGGTFLDVGA